MDVEIIKNETKIDPDIEDIIIRLNNLPFLETAFSCSGHPDIPEKSRSIPYVDIRFNPKMSSESIRFHQTLIETIPNLRFSTIKQKGTNKFMMETNTFAISKDRRVSYQMKCVREDLTKPKIKKFWDGWRSVLAKYGV